MDSKTSDETNWLTVLSSEFVFLSIVVCRWSHLTSSIMRTAHVGRFEDRAHDLVHDRHVVYHDQNGRRRVRESVSHRCITTLLSFWLLSHYCSDGASESCRCSSRTTWTSDPERKSSQWRWAWNGESLIVLTICLVIDSHERSLFRIAVSIATLRTTPSFVPEDEAMFLPFRDSIRGPEDAAMFLPFPESTLPEDKPIRWPEDAPIFG